MTNFSIVKMARRTPKWVLIVAGAVCCGSFVSAQLQQRAPEAHEELLTYIEPEFPSKALKSGLQNSSMPAAPFTPANAICVYDGFIGVDGRIRHPRFLSGDSQMCLAADDALVLWRYRPITQAGKAVEVERTFKVDLTFKLVGGNDQRYSLEDIRQTYEKRFRLVRQTFPNRYNAHQAMFFKDKYNVTFVAGYWNAFKLVKEAGNPSDFVIIEVPWKEIGMYLEKSGFARISGQDAPTAGEYLAASETRKAIILKMAETYPSVQFIRFAEPSFHLYTLPDIASKAPPFPAVYP